MQELSRARLNAVTSSASIASSASAPPEPSAGTSSPAAEFTVEAVDAVLEQVRPYLISDGGNVAVVSVDPDEMSVSLVLQGACGSCPSSTTTMKMGIERVLREEWLNLGDVKQVEAVEEALTVPVVEEILAPIMPAISALGGQVEIVSAQGSAVQIAFSGPENTRKGIVGALKDHELIDKVEFM